MQAGVKNDQGKTQWHYMDNFWPELEEVVAVLTMGDQKYPSEDGANWKRVDDAERRYNDARLRHDLAYRKGEKIDPESGKPHLAHVISNAFFSMYFDRMAGNVEYYHRPTLEKLEVMVKDILDNCTNYSAPRSEDHDRQIIAPHLEAVLDEIDHLKGK